MYTSSRARQLKLRHLTAKLYWTSLATIGYDFQSIGTTIPALDSAQHKPCYTARNTYPEAKFAKQPQAHMIVSPCPPNVRLFVFILLLAACAAPAPATDRTMLAGQPAATPGVLAARETPVPGVLPLLSAYQNQIRQALGAEPPVLKLGDLEMQREMAQTIALGDTRLTDMLRDQETGAPLRSQVFGVVPMRASDQTEANAPCASAKCYRVEIYNFAVNETLSAVVDIDRQQLVAVTRIPSTQPDIPPKLEAVAREIAASAPEVKQALGVAPDAEAAQMANTKTALNKTRCERSEHLCVAPTFVSGDRALWAIVDLTDGVLVGVRWTNVGTTGPAVTEKGLENDAVLQFCNNTTRLERNGWSFDYVLTSSDGLRISDVRFDGKPFINSAKLVDWHVSYSREDGFGYSDAVGCPFFSQAAVVAVRPPEVEEVREGNAIVGFRLKQEYWSELWPTPCNYYYEQAYTFYVDGRFRPAVASVGRGCGDDGTYRPVTRIALAGDATFSAWDGASWQPWATERWQGETDRTIGPNAAEYRISTENGSFTMATGRGQFGDGGRGDAAFVYVTRLHADRDEGESDLLTIGPCCNTNEDQGPERFIEDPPEPIAHAPLVVWYVAQLKNDGRPSQEYCWSNSVLDGGLYNAVEFPCWSGPMFTPVEG